MFGRKSAKKPKTPKRNERLVERRKRKRFDIEEGVFAILRGASRQLGEVTNASGGGLAFKYQGEENGWKESSELEILVPDHSFKIKRLTIKGVWDSKTANEMRKRGIQFGKLSYKQRSQLRTFIQNYSL